MKSKSKKIPYIILQEGQMIYSNLQPFNKRSSFHHSKLQPQNSNNQSIKSFQTPINKQKRGKFNNFMKQQMFNKEQPKKSKNVKRQLSMKTKGKQIHSNLKKQKSRKSLINSDINLLKSSISKKNPKIKISFREQRQKSQKNYSKLIDNLTQKVIKHHICLENQENSKKQLLNVQQKQISQSRKRSSGCISINRKKTVQKILKNIKQFSQKSKLGFKEGVFNDFLQEKKFIEQIMNQIEQKKDVYEPIKNYIDFIQDNKVEGIFLDKMTSYIQKSLKKFMLINRLLVCLTLYLYLNQNLKQEKIYLIKIYEKQIQNYIIVEQYFDANFFQLKMKFKLFEDKQTDESTMKNLQILSNNNSRSLKQIKQILQLSCSEITAQIEKFEQFQEELKFQEGQKLILNIFENQFFQKGIIAQDIQNKDVKKYSLILDLDETLIYFDETKAQVFFRPYLDFFLQECSKIFDLCIFTASLQEYADEILNHLEIQQKFFEKRYYRKHLNANKIKDIQKIGFDIDNTIIVDDKQQNLDLQKDNGILIDPWYGDNDDESLMKLYHYLLKLSQNKGSVRNYIKMNKFN